MKIAIVGYGSIGKRHERVLKSFDVEVQILRRGNPAVACDVAVICTPTEYHVSYAIEYALLGAALFIEKPLSSHLDGMDELSRIVSIKNTSTYVAYPLRHDEFLREARGDIRGITCLSNAAMWPSRRKLDNVLLEMSHELDIAYWSDAGAELRGSLISDHAFYGTLGNVSLNLNMQSQFEVREYVTKWKTTYVPKVDDELYRKQWEWFFENMHYGMENNIRQARALLEQILGFIG